MFITYGLDESFNINDYENWIPAHSYCNQWKSDRIYEGLPLIKTILDNCANNKELEQRLEMQLEQAPKKTELLAKLQAAIDMNLTNLRELQDFVLKSNIIDADDEELKDIKSKVVDRVEYQTKKMVHGLKDMAVTQTMDVLSGLCRELGEDWSFGSFYVGLGNTEETSMFRRHDLMNRVDFSLKTSLFFKPTFFDKKLMIEISNEKEVLETVIYDLKQGVDWTIYREAVKKHYKEALQEKLK